MQSKIKIDLATEAQLRDFAEVTLQLGGADKAAPADLKAMVRNAWPNDFIYADVAELPQDDAEQSEEVRAVAQIKALGSGGRDDPKWIVEIASTELPGGKDPVPVSVNGHNVLIQRNMPVEIPHRYIEALRKAVRISMRQDLDTNKTTRTSFTNYPIGIVHDQPTQQEIADWFERTKDLELA